MKLRSYLWLPVFAAATLMLYKYLPQTEGSSLAATTTSETAGRAPTDSSSGLRSQLSAHELRLLALEQQGGAPEELEREAEPAPAPRREPPTVEQMEERAAERMEHLDDALAQERIDTSWAGSTESLLREAVKSAEARGTKVLSSVCKETLCRMEVLHDNEDSRQAFEDTRRAQPMTYFFQPVLDEQGRHKTIAYFVRQGQEKNGEHAFTKLFAAQGR